MTFQPLVGTSAGTRRSEDSGWFGAALGTELGSGGSRFKPSAEKVIQEGARTPLEHCLVTGSGLYPPWAPAPPLKHLKMMRLLFLCLLLLLPTTTDVDDEDLNEDPDFLEKYGSGLGVAGSMGDEERADNFIMVVIVVAVAALTLSVAAIVRCTPCLWNSIRKGSRDWRSGPTADSNQTHHYSPSTFSTHDS
ncbi:hypothetical protein D4764_10G0003960 [Takifugu flavidus]|uniref:Uncharacterized protein n=1 Tax=Takifugu flavidus TaxID=433684 RepID=A0A5C6PKG1_9TELE|nr:hypothetical protein D4764_10G0003960 [Takifugu flavidus]